MMNQIIETIHIDRLVKNFAKAPHKVGDTHESDAEIIDLGKGVPNYLAVTTDALVEEVSSGLYDDPYFIGWMLAMSNFSDLAAVGADPLGLLLSVSYPSNGKNRFAERFAKGVSKACEMLETYVIGGDTNHGEEPLFSATAVGLVPKRSILTRMGASVKDRLYLSHPAGLGNVYAFLKMSRMNVRLPGMLYKPMARIKEGKLLRYFASSCMDTSDGVLHAVDTLMRLNTSQFALSSDWARICHPMAYRMCRFKSIPPWLALAGIHGEFELVFTVKPQRESRFLEAASKIGWDPILIGEVRQGQGITIKNTNGNVPLDTTAIRNLSEQAGRDAQSYIRQLVQIAKETGIA
jgi:thiamine-monophosphate kinase